MGAQQKILVVDDEGTNIDVLVHLLKPDYKIMVAKTGKQALKIARSASRPDLILLDIMMPEIDGYQVCHQLQADEVTRDIPIIFVSAMGQETDETKGLELGAVDYITKPIAPSIVKARVKTHLALKRNMEALQKAYRIIETQKERMQTELNIAHDIQMSMLPVRFPDRPEFDIHAVLEPAFEVGGDFYDCFFVDDDRLCFCIGDVSDKGVPSALFMAMTKTMIKSRAATDFSTASILTHVNNELSKDNDSCMFVTLFVGVLNLATGVVTCTNAGHNPPLLKRADGTVTYLKRRDGAVVGSLPGLAYTEDTLALEPGDILLLYTDGVTEAEDGEGNLFSTARLADLLTRNRDNSPKTLVDAVNNAVKAYEQGVPQADDITILALKYKSPGGEPVARRFETTINNQISEIRAVCDRFDRSADRWGIPEGERNNIHMALDELLSNIMTHAYTDREQHQIQLAAELDRDTLVISICDDGIPFNPFTTEPPDLALSVEERQLGGLGIHLVKNMFDRVSYQRGQDRNLVTLTKTLVQASH